jgi:hypothetical protein
LRVTIGRRRRRWCGSLLEFDILQRAQKSLCAPFCHRRRASVRGRRALCAERGVGELLGSPSNAVAGLGQVDVQRGRRRCVCRAVLLLMAERCGDDGEVHLGIRFVPFACGLNEGRGRVDMRQGWFEITRARCGVELRFHVLELPSPPSRPSHKVYEEHADGKQTNHTRNDDHRQRSCRAVAAIP